MSEERPRAVLVEDNMMFAVALQPRLEAAGYAVTVRSGGPGDPAAIAADPPALLCVNLSAQRYAGADFVRRLRELPALAETPLLGYAGHVERALFVAGREAGCDLVAPNSAMRQALPEVLRKLAARHAGATVEEWPDDD